MWSQFGSFFVAHWKCPLALIDGPFIFPYLKLFKILLKNVHNSNSLKILIFVKMSIKMSKITNDLFYFFKKSQTFQILKIK